METTVQGQQYLTAPELEHQRGNGTQETNSSQMKTEKLSCAHYSFKLMILQKNPPD